MTDLHSEGLILVGQSAWRGRQGGRRQRPEDDQCRACCDQGRQWAVPGKLVGHGSQAHSRQGGCRWTLPGRAGTDRWHGPQLNSRLPASLWQCSLVGRGPVVTSCFSGNQCRASVPPWNRTHTS